MPFTVHGKVFEGVLRGIGIIEYYYPRIVGLIGYHPYKGTLNIKLDFPIDVKKYSTKTISHVLLDGKTTTNAFLAPIQMKFQENVYECWAIRETKEQYSRDVIEIIAKDNLHEKFGLKEGMDIEITFLSEEKPKKFGFWREFSEKIRSRKNK
jgi:CTP-dependent riboflavin kinase